MEILRTVLIVLAIVSVFFFLFLLNLFFNSPPGYAENEIKNILDVMEKKGKQHSINYRLSVAHLQFTRNMKYMIPILMGVIVVLVYSILFLNRLLGE